MGSCFVGLSLASQGLLGALSGALGSPFLLSGGYMGFWVLVALLGAAWLLFSA